MKNTVTCPACQTEFDLDKAITVKLEESIRKQYEVNNQKLISQFQEKEMTLNKMVFEFEEKKKKENELLLERVQKETDKKVKEVSDRIRLEESKRVETELEFFKKQHEENETKLRNLKKQEVQILELKSSLAIQKEEEEYNLKKMKLQVEAELKERLSVEILEKERLNFDLQKRELEKQLSDQKKLTDQMSRKLEQGSMQTQGEIQELALEEFLKQTFPFDAVLEVGKGKSGADCILLVRNERGQEAGKILFESKRTKTFQRDWLHKLKDDNREAKADILVLVSQTLPPDIKHFDRVEGVWVCGLNEVISLVKVLREGLLQLARSKQNNENKGEKKEMLYQYFTGNEFLQFMNTVNEAYLSLKSGIDRERLQMEKIWKEREKQLDKILLNNSHLLGSIQGIAGPDMDDKFLD